MLKHIAPLITTLLLQPLAGAAITPPLAYIVYANNPSLLVIVETTTGLAFGHPVFIGSYAAAVVVHPTGRLAYVLNSNSSPFDDNGSVSVVSSGLQSVIATIPVGRRPIAASLSPDGASLYVSNEFSSSVSVIDTNTNRVAATIPVGFNPHDIAIDPTGSYLYVACSHSIYVISVASRAVIRQIPLMYAVTDYATGLAISPDGQFLYAAEGGGINPPRLIVVTAATGDIVTSIQLGINAGTVVINKAGTRVYVNSAPIPDLPNGIVTVLDTSTNQVVTRIPTRTRFPVGIALTPDDNFLWITNGNETVSVLNTGTNTIVNTVVPVNNYPLVASTGAFVGTGLDAPTTAPVVEYYAQSLDHYFMTQDANEVAALDSGLIAGWSRTGGSFSAYMPGKADLQSLPVCRLYGVPSAGIDSHFYSIDQNECDITIFKYPGAWVEESTYVFEIDYPRSEQSGCAQGRIPVFRLWNRRVDSNHRYTASLAVRQQMLAKGYVSEGVGPLGVAFCAPQP